jgi:hypothetical protein
MKPFEGTQVRGIPCPSAALWMRPCPLLASACIYGVLGDTLAMVLPTEMDVQRCLSSHSSRIVAVPNGSAKNRVVVSLPAVKP